MTLSEQVANISWPFYLMLIYLIYINYKNTKPSLIPIRKLLLIPVLFILIGGFTLRAAPLHYSISISLWLTGLATGSMIGWMLYKYQPVQAIKESKQLYRPGSWSSLIILFMVLGMQAVNFISSVYRPTLLSQQWYILLWLFMYSSLAGLFLGRFAYSLRCLKVGPYLNEAPQL